MNDTEKKNFQDSRLYPIVFMIIVALVFGLLLSFFYHFTKERVEQHSVLRFQQAVLSLFDLPADDIEKSFQDHITNEENNGLQYYSAMDAENNLIGYCFTVSGSGLWGKITALIALNSEYTELIGIHILDQNETPGLGGRISESGFQSQFTGKTIITDGNVVHFQLIAESDTAADTEINQITGATSSSKAVVDILHNNLITIFDIIGQENDFLETDLGTNN